MDSEVPEAKLDGGSLDETIADPLTAVEREALTKLREHDAAVSALRDDIAGLRQRSASGAASPASMAELRRLVKEAERVEGLLESPKEVLARDALAEAGWPGADLAQARKVLSAVDDCEAATGAARDQIRAEDGNVDGEEPAASCTVFQTLLETWSKLQETEAEMKTTDLPACKVDLMMEARANAISPLCAALMDKIEGFYRDQKPEEGDNIALFKGFVNKLQQEEATKRALDSLQVELPLIEDAAPAPSTPMGGRSVSAGQVADAAAAAVDAAVAALNVASDGPVSEAASTIEVPTQPKIVSPFAIGTAAAHVNDPLLHTVPSVNQRVETDPPSKSSASSAVASRRMSGGVPASSAQRYIVPSGSAELWHAVHVGDEAAVRHFVQAGACDGTLRDASGHSVLWHCLAFNHIGLANFMFDTFPPDSEMGVDAGEIHQRKGDTMFHLMCQSKSFGAETAHLFKRIAAAAPEEVFLRVNQMGLTFFQIAAASLNFWVLTFVLKNFPAVSKALVCMDDHAPLRNMSEAIPQPSPPQYSPSAGFPDHFHVAEMLQADETGLVPYADVAFDVGPDTGGSAAGRFLAHRIIVASESPVLMEELSKLPLTLLPREQVQAAVFRVDPRISKDVWRSALQFMYTGHEHNISYKNDVQKVVELLRACVAYQLPRPLLDFTQACLYPLLPNSSPEIALQVFSICAGATSTDMDVYSALDASTYILLRSAHKIFEETDPQEVAQIVEKIVQSVEKSVFKQKTVSTEQQQQEGAAAAAAPAPNVEGTAMQPRPEKPDMQGMLPQGVRNPQATQLQSMQSSQHMMPQRSPQDMMMQSIRSQQDLLSQSMRSSPDMMAHSMASSMSSPDMLSRSMRGHPDMLAQSMRGTQDAMQMSMRGPPDMLSQSARMNPQDMLSQMQDPRMQAYYAHAQSQAQGAYPRTMAAPGNAQSQYAQNPAAYSQAQMSPQFVQQPGMMPAYSGVHMQSPPQQWR